MINISLVNDFFYVCSSLDAIALYGLMDVKGRQNIFVLHAGPIRIKF